MPIATVEAGAGWQRPPLVLGAPVYNALAHACELRHECGQDVGMTADGCIASLSVAALKRDTTRCDDHAVGVCLEAMRAACPVLPDAAGCADCW